MKEFEEVAIIVNDADEVVGRVLKTDALMLDGRYEIVREEDFPKMVRNERLAYLTELDGNIEFCPTDEEREAAKEKGLTDLDCMDTDRYFEAEPRYREAIIGLAQQGALIGKLISAINSPLEESPILGITFYGKDEKIQETYAAMKELERVNVLTKDVSNFFVAAIPFDVFKDAEFKKITRSVVFDTIPVTNDEIEELSEGSGLITHSLFIMKETQQEAFLEELSSLTRRNITKFRGGVTLDDMECFEEV